MFALKAHVGNSKKNVHVTISKYFYRSNILDFFNITHKEEEVWPDRTHPMSFEESSCVYIPIY